MDSVTLCLLCRCYALAFSVLLGFVLFCCFSFCFLRERERTCVTWEGSGRTWGRGKNIIKRYCMKKLKNIIKQKQGAGSSVTGSAWTERAQVGTAAVCPVSASSRPLGSPISGSHSCLLFPGRLPEGPLLLLHSPAQNVGCLPQHGSQPILLHVCEPRFDDVTSYALSTARCDAGPDLMCRCLPLRLSSCCSLFIL